MAVGDPLAGFGTGEVGIYEFQGSQWTAVQSLPGTHIRRPSMAPPFPSPSPQLAVGAPNESISFPFPSTTEAGTVRLYHRLHMGDFGQFALFHGANDHDHFGTSLDLDGNTLVVGAPDENRALGELSFPNGRRRLPLLVVGASLDIRR